MKRSLDIFIAETKWQVLLLDETRWIPLSLFQQSKTLTEFLDDVRDIELSEPIIPVPVSSKEWSLLESWLEMIDEKDADSSLFFKKMQGIDKWAKLLVVAHHLGIELLLDQLGHAYAEVLDSTSTVEELSKTLQIEIELDEKETRLWNASRPKNKPSKLY
jgi:hypothetical protein